MDNIKQFTSRVALGGNIFVCFLLCLIDLIQVTTCCLVIDKKQFTCFDRSCISHYILYRNFFTTNYVSLTLCDVFQMLLREKALWFKVLIKGFIV